MSWLSRWVLLEKLQKPREKTSTTASCGTAEVAWFQPSSPHSVLGHHDSAPRFQSLGVVTDKLSNQHFITGLYYNILGREPSISEVSGWVNSLQIGAHAAWHCNCSSAAPNIATGIQTAYWSFLGRGAEDATLSF